MNKVRTGSGKSYMFNLCAESRSKLQHLQAFAKHVLGLDVSTSALVRRALALYVQHADALALSRRATPESASGESSKTLDSSEFPECDELRREKYLVKRSVSGQSPVGWKHYPKSPEDRPFATYRELEARYAPTLDAILRRAAVRGCDD